MPPVNFGFIWGQHEPGRWWFRLGLLGPGVSGKRFQPHAPDRYASCRLDESHTFCPDWRPHFRLLFSERELKHGWRVGNWIFHFLKPREVAP